MLGEILLGLIHRTMLICNRWRLRTEYSNFIPSSSAFIEYLCSLHRDNKYVAKDIFYRGDSVPRYAPRGAGGAMVGGLAAVGLPSDRTR